MKDDSVRPQLISEQEIDDFLNVRIVRLASKMQRLMLRHALREAELPILEWRILFSVASDRSTHLGAIIQRGGMDRAHASRAVSSLAAKNLINRDLDPFDNRRRLLTLTPAGEIMFKRVWAAASDLNAGLLKAFEPDELAQLKVLLDRAQDAVDDMTIEPKAEDCEINAA